MIVFVFLAVVQMSWAAVPMMRNMLDPEIIAINDVEGFLYDVPEYEDPLVIQHQLSSIGAMPIFTLLESAKKRGNSKTDDLPEKVKIEESKKVIDDALSRLELARAKLEKGNGNIYTEVEKVIQSLKSLEKSVRPDFRNVLNSLQSLMAVAMAKPIMMPEIRQLVTKNEPDGEKPDDFEKPSFDRQTLKIRVISNKKPEFDKPLLTDSYSVAQKAVPDNKPEFDDKPVQKDSYSVAQKAVPDHKLEFDDKPVQKDSHSVAQTAFDENKPEFKFNPVLKESFISTHKLIPDDKPEFDDKHALKETYISAQRLIPDNKLEFGDKPEFKDSHRSSKSDERSLEEKMSEEISQSSESSDIPKEGYEATKPPFEFKLKEKKNTNIEGDDLMSSYKAKLTWKAAGQA